MEKGGTKDRSNIVVGRICRRGGMNATRFEVLVVEDVVSSLAINDRVGMDIGYWGSKY